MPILLGQPWLLFTLVVLMLTWGGKLHHKGAAARTNAEELRQRSWQCMAGTTRLPERQVASSSVHRHLSYEWRCTQQCNGRSETILIRNDSYGNFFAERPKPSTGRKIARMAPICGQNWSHRLRLSFLRFSHVLVAKNHTKLIKNEVFDPKC